MYDSFAAIDPERKKRILDAAYKEFACNGYKGASTNRIIAEAGIGKGPLFSYFGNKQGLFIFLVEHALDFIEDYMSKVFAPQIESDFIEQYRVASKQKLEASIKEPYVFEFLTWLYLNMEEITLFEDVEEYISKYAQRIESIRKKFMKNFTQNHDISKFRKDIPVEKLIKYIGWTLDGYTMSLTERVKANSDLTKSSLLPYWAEFDEIVDDLKLLFYEM